MALARDADEKMMDEARATTHGEARSLAEVAASRGWRATMQPKQQVRSELLRMYAEENVMSLRPGAKGYKSPHAWLWRDHTEGKKPPPPVQPPAEDD